MATRILGTRVPRLDAVDKTTGRTKFVGDMVLPGMAYAKLVHSSYPHARIKRINTTRAEKHPGVIGVVTHKDVPDHLHGELIWDERLFAKEKVRYQGDIIAIVAAEDQATADAAAKLVKVDYEPLKAVFDAEQAMKPGAPLIHENWKSYACLPSPKVAPVWQWQKQNPRRNCSWSSIVRKGDVEKGFKEADVVVKGVYTTPMVHGSPIENHSVLAEPHDDGSVTIWTATQVPYVVRMTVAAFLDIPISQVRVIAPAIGGGFGAKCQAWVEPHAAALALKTGRPVKLVFNREEEFSMAQPRHPAKMYVKSGIKKDGTIVAREATIYFDTGFTSMLSAVQGSLGALTAAGPYKIPNLKIDVYCVYTNKPSCSAVRGPSGPQLNFCIESHMDELARNIGMDPLALRLKNGYEEGDIAHNGQKLQAVGLKQCLRTAAERIGWKQPKAAGGDGMLVGRGLSCAWWITAVGFGTGALVAIEQDGTVHITTGTVEHGTGSTFGTAPMVVAEELGVDVKQVRVHASDTGIAPFDYGGVGSRTTFNLGHALRQASQDARRQLMANAAAMIEANPDDLDMANGMIFVKGTPEKGIPFAIVAQAAPFALGPIVGRGSFNTMAPPFDPKHGLVEGSLFISAQLSYAAQAAVVEVDRETGNVKVTDFAAAHDVGYSINPLCVEGQIEGGAVMGLGIALSERVGFDSEGRMQNPSFLDYKIPLCCDVPPIKFDIIETNNIDGPYGSKGIGEPPIVPTTGAVANAVADAIGVHVTELPLLPERVLAAMKTVKKR